MNWQDFSIGIALMLVFEGILPFLSPTTLKRLYASVFQMNEQNIRLMGLISMVLGIIILYWIKKG